MYQAVYYMLCTVCRTKYRPVVKAGNKLINKYLIWGGNKCYIEKNKSGKGIRGVSDAPIIKKREHACQCRRWIIKMQARSTGLIKSPRENCDKSYPCLENPLERGAWRATVHMVTKSQT